MSNKNTQKGKTKSQKQQATLSEKDLARIRWERKHGQKGGK